METGLEDQFQRVAISDGKQVLSEVQPRNTKPLETSCSEEDQLKIAALMKKARGAVEEGHPRAALEILQQAAKIQHTEKIAKRIAKLEAYLAENGSEDEEEEDDNMVHVGKGFYVYKDLYNKLYDYQRESLLWFWRLHRKNKGGILGDDMGLGKTVQVVAFMSGLFDLEQVSSVLIVVPVALVINWEREFKNWAPGINLYIFHGASKKERERQLERVQKRGGVLMVSYGLVLTCWEQLNRYHGAEFVWDYIILDEGHKIKNPTKTTKAVSAVAATHRFILTGTPIQNNLKELWSLFNFVTHGTLLGTLQTFKSEYDNPITRAREKDATASEKLLGNEMAESLRLLIAPYFLRRTKADVLEKRKDGQSEEKETESDSSSVQRDRSMSPQTEIPSLTRKNDLIVWLSLTETQIKIYQDFISLDSVKELLMTRRSPLAELTILKKLCDHPRLLSKRACRQLGLEMSHDGYDENEDPNEMESAANNIHLVNDEVLFQESGKLQFLVKLLTNLRSEGHRCLVFSQSRKMLDIVEKVLKARHFKLMRLDGTITKLSEREDRISRFQGNDSYSVFLLTTQVGGVGLTLTGADRVVIIDPSWNPATDNQAVDRVYRIGQTRTVVIYRLITCGTVEEKIYRRQIFKESLTKQATGSSKNPYRYFTGQQLRELFVLDDPQTSQTQIQLEAMHAAHRKTDTELDAHIAFLYSTGMFGISDHDLMFSQEAQAEKHHEDFEEEGSQYIQQRVQRAQELVAAESDLTRKLNDHIQRGTEAPGGSKKRYSMNINRERLQSEWAEQTGEGAINPPLRDVPKYYKPEQRPPPRVPRTDDAFIPGTSRAPETIIYNLDDSDDAVVDNIEETGGSDGEDLLEDSPANRHVSSPEDVEIIDDHSDDDEAHAETENCDIIDDDSFANEPHTNFSGHSEKDDVEIDDDSRAEESHPNVSQQTEQDDDGAINDMDSSHSSCAQDFGSAQVNSIHSPCNQGYDLIQDANIRLDSSMSPELVVGGHLGQRQGDVSDELANDDDNFMDVSVSSFSAQAEAFNESGSSPSLLSHGHDNPVSEDYVKEKQKTERDDLSDLSSKDDDDSYIDVSVASFCAQAEEGSASSISPLTTHISDHEITSSPKQVSGRMSADSESYADENDESYVDVSVASFCVQAGEHSADSSQSQSELNSEQNVSPPKESSASPVLAKCGEMLPTESFSAEKLVRDSGQVSITSSSSLSNPLEKCFTSLDLNTTSRLLGLTGTESPSVDNASSSVTSSKHILSVASDEEEEDYDQGSKSSRGSRSSERTEDGGSNIRVEDSEDEMEGEGAFSSPRRYGDEGTVIDDSLSAEDSIPWANNEDRNRERKIVESSDEGEEKEEEEDDAVIERPKRRTQRQVIEDSDEESEDGNDGRDGGDDDDDIVTGEKEVGKSETKSNSNILEDSNGDELGHSVDWGSRDVSMKDEDDGLHSVNSHVEEEEEGRSVQEQDSYFEDSAHDGSVQEQDSYFEENSHDDVEEEEENEKEEEEDARSVQEQDSYFEENAHDDVGEEEMEGDEEESDREDDEEGVGSFIVDDDDETEETYHEDEDGIFSEEQEEEEEEEEEEGEEEDGSEDDLDEETREQYKALVKKGMSRLSEGDNRGALKSFLQALYIDGSSQQLQMVALKLKKKIDQEQS